MATPIIAPESSLFISPTAQFILASQSPRRYSLLTQLQLTPQVIAANVDEKPLEHELPVMTIQRLAQLKASTVAARLQQITLLPILAADTGVIIDNQLLGQPRHLNDALAMWHCLSGRWHHVVTAVVLIHAAQTYSITCTTAVKMRSVHSSEITAYWAIGEPCDKAGGYAIQGLGSVFIERIIGSYSNVVGLPLFETAALLQTAGIILFK